MLLHYLGKLKNSNFFADIQQIWKKMQTNCVSSASSLIRLRMYLCMLSVIMYFFIKILSLLLNTTLIVDKHSDCSDVCCDEFPVLQIDRKCKKVKEQWDEKFYLEWVWGKARYCKHRKNQNLWTNNKVIGNKNAICLHFLPYLLNVYRKFDF